MRPKTPHLDINVVRRTLTDHLAKLVMIVEGCAGIRLLTDTTADELKEDLG